MPKKTDLFVDTSGWALYLDRTDPLYAPTRDAIQAATASGRKLITTNYIIAELVALLATRYKRPRPQVIIAINAIRADSAVEIIHVDPTTEDEAWRLLEGRQDKEWSLVDAASFVLPGRHGMTEALTTDQHFTQAGFTRLPSP